MKQPTERTRRGALVPTLAVVLPLLAGCALPTVPGPPGPEEAGPGAIVRLGTGETVLFDALLEDLCAVDIVYLGETHSRSADHQVQERIVRALTDAGRPTVLAMEMFPRSAQPLLDDWWQGKLDEKAFLEKVRWKEVWGYPFGLYRNLVLWARDHRVPLIGLNAPKFVVGKIARTGLESLTPEERSRIARQIDPWDRAHRAYVLKQYGKHPQGEIRDFEAFYQAQLAWEETMAETLSEVLLARQHKERILVLAGRGHLRGRFGIPERVARRAPHAYRVVLPLPAPVDRHDLDPRTADYVWVTAPQ